MLEKVRLIPLDEGDLVPAQSIAVVGAGYVGLTAAACLARLGHRVCCADNDFALVSQLRRGQVGLAEPGLAELVRSGLATGTLTFTADARDAVTGADAVFLCLPTPAGPGGAPDLADLALVVTEVADALRPGAMLIIKSTVLPGTAAKVGALLGRADVAVAANPEFLREGHAVPDFLHPNRIVIGADGDATARRVLGIYAGLVAPAVITSTVSAELAKYAANCFLAVKLSYINEVAALCEHFGADITQVTTALGDDQRIGSSYLRPGPGWGGPCLLKDAQALLHASARTGSEFALLRAAVASNEQQHQRIVVKTRLAAGGTLIGKRISLLGLAFKAGTCDTRGSPALEVANLLAAEQARVTGYDPAVTSAGAGLTVTGDPYQAVAHAAVVVLLTEWPEFRSLDWPRIRRLMAGDTVIDARNHLDPAALHQAGLRWEGIGTSARE